MATQNNSQKEIDKVDKPFPLWFMFLLPIYTGGVLSLMLFPFAGDWRWLEGWAFIITFIINIGISYFYINRKNPRVLRNRMKLKKVGLTEATRKPARSDFFILPLMGLGFFGAMILPALGHRFDWTALPFALEMAGLALTNLGFLIINIATLQNAYASKILDINEGQKLVDTGLYAHIRHPLYAGGVLMAFALPFALGSWWGQFPAAAAAFILMFRIKFEEEMLLEGMEGYADYQKRVPYKLIPGIY